MDHLLNHVIASKTILKLPVLLNVQNFVLQNTHSYDAFSLSTQHTFSLYCYRARRWYTLMVKGGVGETGPFTTEILTHSCSCNYFFPLSSVHNFYYQLVVYCVCSKMVCEMSL